MKESEKENEQKMSDVSAKMLKGHLRQSTVIITSQLLIGTNTRQMILTARDETTSPAQTIVNIAGVLVMPTDNR